MKKLALILFLTLFAASAAQGATYSVTNGLDDGTGSLRQAVRQANANGGTVSVNSSVKQIYLDRPIQVDTGNDFTIEGNGVAVVGDNDYGTRLFEVSQGTVQFNRMTFTNGYSGDGGSGGAVLISGIGAAEFTNCTFLGNVASADGGAVCVNVDNSGLADETVFQNCTLAGNYAFNGKSGGVQVQNGFVRFYATVAVDNNCFPETAPDLIEDLFVTRVGEITGWVATAQNRYDISGESGGTIYNDSSYNVIGSTDITANFPALYNTVGVRGQDVLNEAKTVNNVIVFPLTSRSPARDCVPEAYAATVDEVGTKRPQGDLKLCDAGAYEEVVNTSSGKKGGGGGGCSMGAWGSLSLAALGLGLLALRRRMS